MITAELIDRLLEATNEAKATLRECHEARRDLKLAIKEADDRIGRVRAEVIATVDELATEKTKATFDRLDIERISANLKRTLDQWITLLGEANEVLAALQKRAGTL
jgi:hypothetical protein